MASVTRDVLPPSSGIRTANSLSELFAKISATGRESRHRIHEYFYKIWPALHEKAITGIRRRITTYNEKIASNEVTIKTLRERVAGDLRTTSPENSLSITEPMVTRMEKLSQLIRTQRGLQLDRRKLYDILVGMQLGGTRPSILTVGANHIDETVARFPYCHGSDTSGKSLSKQSPAHFASGNGREFFRDNHQSRVSDWNAASLRRRSIVNAREWTTKGRQERNLVDFSPVCFYKVRADYGLKRGRVMALLMTMDQLLNLGARPAFVYANDIEAFLNTPAEGVLPPINSVVIVVGDTPLRDSDGDERLDPVLYTPFPKGTRVHKMKCCNAHLCEETIAGIIESGRTPKCPMCRGRLMATS